MNAIETHDLVKRYRKHVVIDHVSMSVPEGSIYGFVGENGAGKTTIMRLITGLAEPTSGTFEIFGVSNKDKNIFKVRGQTAAIVEMTSLVPTMTAKENLKFASLYLGLKETPDFDAILRKVGLGNVGNKKVKNFSLGMRQRLGIANALLGTPKLMLLDEPMNGLDPEGIAELRDLLLALNHNDNITILISSHILSELEKIATHYGIISHGRMIKTITVEELHTSCRKGIEVTVNDVSKAIKALKSKKINNFKEVGNNVIKIFDDVKITDVITYLTAFGIDIKNIINKEESIEDYYLSLIKEGK